MFIFFQYQILSTEVILIEILVSCILTEENMIIISSP